MMETLIDGSVVHWILGEINPLSLNRVATYDDENCKENYLGEMIKYVKV